MKFNRQLIFLVALFFGLPVAFPGSVVNSKHNLSASGPGTIIATSETQICIFCHTPHNSTTQAPLWNRYDSGATYTLYTSSTTKSTTIAQPTGASKLCLSCHDGTVALGMVRSRAANIAMRNGVTTLPGTSASNLGTDLSDDHPISFTYNDTLVAANGQLNSPPTTGRVHVDSTGSMQCTSCHEPHDPQYGSFLAMDNTASAICITCHNKTYWNQSSHKTSTKVWNGIAPNPWPHTKFTTVAANACENCHDPHGAGGKSRLMNYAAEEQNCYSCHNGNIVAPATKNVQAEFSKASVHPVTLTTGTHDPTEATLVSASTAHHVECEDCHNPHAAYPASGTLPGGLTGVRGIDVTGGDLPTISREYELCFRCHADTAKGPARVTRQTPNINTRQEFQNINGVNSYHPVISVGRNSDVPSLKSPWTIASLTGCTDCHNSDASPSAGGSGANGPHGSAYTPILERAMNLTDTRSTTVTAALCFKCHNLTWANNTDPFQSSGGDSLHTIHLNKNCSCTACHDPHGSPQQHLINFDTTVVRAINGVGPSYTWRGARSGTCTLLCHGEDHTPKSYP